MLHFGVLPLRDLRAQGMGRREIEEALSTGTLLRIRRGWYADPRAHRDVIGAVAAGGRLGCVSGCRLHGLWDIGDQRLHVMMGAGCVEPPKPGIIHHPTQQPQFREAVWPLLDCLEHVIHRHSVETALVLVEDAVAKRKISVSQARTLLADSPERKRMAAQHFQPSAQSGSETRLRLFLQRNGVRFRAQAHISGVGYVDFLVGESLIIECDSETHHTGERYHVDRVRDLAAVAQGYTVINHHIWTMWEQTQLDLRRCLQSRRHRLPPRTS